MINTVQEKGIGNKTAVRYDMLTYSTAKEYIKNINPGSLLLVLVKPMILLIKKDTISIYSKLTRLIK